MPAEASSNEALELRSIFSLQPDEVLVEDFACSLWHKFHLPGRLFIFQHYVCFLHKMPPMNEMIVVVPHREIVQVAKAKSMKIISNAIEIEHNLPSPSGEPGPTKLFFSNFLKRDQAHQVLTRTWTLASGPQTRDSVEDASATSAAEPVPIPGSASESQADGVASSCSPDTSSSVSPPTNSSSLTGSESSGIHRRLPSADRAKEKPEKDAQAQRVAKEAAEKAAKEAEEMADTEKERVIRLAKDLGIPETESLVGELECKVETRDRSLMDQDLEQEVDKLAGTFYMFKNYICFRATLDKKKTTRSSLDGAEAFEGKERKKKPPSQFASQWSCLLRDVVSIEKATTALVVGNAIKLRTTELMLHIVGIKNRDSVLSTLLSLWEVSKAMVDIDPRVSKLPPPEPPPEPEPASPEPMSRMRSNTVGKVMDQASGASAPAATSSPGDLSGRGRQSGSSTSLTEGLVESLGPRLPLIIGALSALLCLWLLWLLHRLSSLEGMAPRDAKCAAGAVQGEVGMDLGDIRVELEQMRHNINQILGKLDGRQE